MRALVASVLVGASLVGPAFAGPPTPGPACPPPKTAWLPGGYDVVTRQVPVPAVLTDRYMRVWETVTEPVIECREVPRMVPRQAPVFGLRQVPVYETRKTPICREVTVPVYAYRTKPVLGPSWTCANEEKLVPWWSINEKVQCGVTTERRVVGYKEERVKVGMATERCPQGFRTEMVACGTRTEQKVVGTREVRRCIGWRTETVESAPATVKQVCERVERPGRWVTLSDAAARPAPLPGTEVTLTNAEYRAELARNQRRGR